ncbi:coilin [Gastrolobium bilobum]|uniref:coilin n=1 Tax=Gastrolobium bilobum TaxID=150636 RepID=UPI002AB1BE6D|nr:coilin [Gastrolobium bilobum]
MAETIRLRVVFEERRMLSKSKKKEGLKRSWFLLKPQLNTISDVASHLQNTFRLHRTCPHGIILLMDGFVLPSFESTRILKDKDIVCVRRKGSILAYDKPAMLPSETRGQRSIELPKLLAIEGFQEESGGYETMSQEDNNDQLEDAVYVESKSDGKPISKKRKASKKLKSPSQKKIKLSTTENLAVIPEVHEEENESFQGSIHHESSLVKKNNGKSSNLSSQPNKSGKDNFNKQMNDKSGSTSDETRFLQPQDEGGTKKLPSRSARRRKDKRRWLRELKLEKEKFHTSPMLEKDGQQLPIKDKNSLVSDVHQQPDEESEEEDDIVPGLKKDGQHLPIKDNNCIVSDVHEQPDEESEEEDDVVPVEIRPGHIRFEPRRKDQTVPQNQFPVETFQWNGITSKKKGQKWGKERNSFRKQDDYEHSSQECPTVQNAEKKHALNAADFDKLTPYTSLPKEGDVIAYRLIELSTSWTPELSSFRVGKISQYDAKSNRIWLEPVLEYPFVFEKKIDGDTSSLQSDPSPYQEDGSLEIDYVSLADVRMVKHGRSDLATVVVSSDDLVNPTKANNGSTDGSCMPEREGHIHTKENGEVNVWDEINEALKAKKAKLSQEDGWSKEQSSGTRSWSNRALRCSALGPTMAFLRSKNGL